MCSETQRCTANLQSIFDLREEKFQISQDHDMLDGSEWECRTANTSHVTDDQFERFHTEVKQKIGPTSERERKKVHSGSSRDVFCFFPTLTQS